MFEKSIFGDILRSFTNTKQSDRGQKMETRIYKCFIASPSDVQEERKVCDTVFSEINKTIGEQKGFRIESVKWEEDAVPDFSSDSQDVINKQLSPGGHDFFIGIIWKRFGTPTNRAESGTLEEFNLAYDSFIKTKKPYIQLYFKEAAIPFSEIVPEDISKIQKFKEGISKKGGLYATFSDINSFSSQLRKNITKVILGQNDLQSSTHNGISKKLSDILKDALFMFYGQPVQWIDRLLCKPEDISESFNECIDKSVGIDCVLNTSKSCIIKAPPQFGLTCLAHKIRKEAWERNNQAYMYIDLDNFKIRKFQQEFESEQVFF